MYELKSTTKKEIILALSKGKAVDTKTLKKNTGCKNISREIDHIRNAVTCKFDISGNLFIPPTKAGQGYIIGSPFSITKRKLHP